MRVAAAAGSGDVDEAGSRLGTMAMVMWIRGLLYVGGFCGMLAWYSVLLQRLRGVITAHLKDG